MTDCGLAPPGVTLRFPQTARTADFAAWQTEVANNASASGLTTWNTWMITSPRTMFIPPVSGDRTYEFITYITEWTDSSRSVALMGNGSFCYKLFQYGANPMQPGSTRYGISDDKYTPLGFGGVQVYLNYTHLAFVVQADGTGLLYINGELSGTMAAGLQPVLSGEVTMGAGGPNMKDSMGNGFILANAVYDKALDSNAVKQRYNAWNAEATGAATYASEVLKDHPAHWWRLNEQYATQSALDSGLAPPIFGAYTGGCTPYQTSFNSGAGKAVRFAGSESADPGRVVIPNFPQYRHFTIEAWVYVDTDASAVYMPAVTHETPDRYLSYSFAPGVKRMRGQMSVRNGGSADEYGVPVVTRGKWHHVAIRSAGGMGIIVDGQEIGAEAVMQAVANGTTSGTLNIGSVVGGVLPLGFKGMIDEVAVYPYTVNTYRLKQHYLAGGGVMPRASAQTMIATDRAWDQEPFLGMTSTVPWDVGRLATLSIPAGSQLKLSADSAPLARLMDNKFGDHPLDSVSSPGPDGVADGVFFADDFGGKTARLLVTFPEPIYFSYLELFAASEKSGYPARSRLAGSVYMSSSTTTPATGGNLAAVPAWKKMGDLWNTPHNQVKATVQTLGFMSPVKFLLFDFDNAGGGQFPVLRELEIRGGPAYSEPDLQIALIGPKKIRLSWKAEYENWYLTQYIGDHRYSWTSTFLGFSYAQYEGFRAYTDYDIPEAGYWWEPLVTKSMFRMMRPAPDGTP